MSQPVIAIESITIVDAPPLPLREDFIRAYVRQRPDVPAEHAGKLYDLLAGPPYEWRGAIADWASAFMAVEEARGVS